MMEQAQQRSCASATDDRRQHERVNGPFDGRRLGDLDTPIRIYDLSEGGCFVNSMHEQQVGAIVVLEIELPYEGWITVTGQTLYRKPDFGYAVRFSGMSDEAALRLRRAVERLISLNQISR
jgi:hypothetical protein